MIPTIRSLPVSLLGPRQPFKPSRLRSNRSYPSAYARPAHQCRRFNSMSGAGSGGLAPADQKSDDGHRVMFSGIQPSGVPHIGNYIGALQNWVKFQELKKSHKDGRPIELYYSIVGLHAITLPRNPSRLRRDRFEMMCVLLALGLDPDHSCLFNQEQVPAHSEMAWILNCIAPVGRLSRMTTWKSQIASSKNSNSIEEVDESMLHLGLLAYPVLQAADILLYKTTHVTVGEDQVQHLELTKVLAKALNNQTKTQIFRLPQGIYSSQSKILNLRNPTVKMSKSNPSDLSKILLTDKPKEISKKIKSAITDSMAGLEYDPENRPGISNLIDIYRSISNQELNQVLDRFRHRSISDLKLELIDLLVDHFRPFQTEYARLLGFQDEVEKIYSKGAQRASGVANRTLSQVKELLGLT